MTASEAPLAGVRVDHRVMRLAALFVQPYGCYAGRQDECCASNVCVVQSQYATQRPRSRQGVPRCLSRSKPRESAVAYRAMAKGQPREGYRTIKKMGEDQPRESVREKARVAREKQRETPADTTRMAETSWVQRDTKRTRRSRSAATQKVRHDGGNVCCSSKFSGRVLRYLRAVGTWNEKLFKAIYRSLSRNRRSKRASLSWVQYHAWKRERCSESVASWGGLS
jgi:hypothetical protein